MNSEPDRTTQTIPIGEYNFGAMCSNHKLLQHPASTTDTDERHPSKWRKEQEEEQHNNTALQ